jgi:prolipoprotein diacylglyceryltransferase
MKDLSGCRYPVTLYSAAAQVVLFFILVSMSSNSSRKMKPGRIFLAFLFFSGIFRFFLDFLVEDKTYFFLTNGQWLSLITIFFSLVLFMFEKRRGCLFKKPNTHKLDN